MFYVSPSGSDTAAGSQGAPWRTLNYAFSQLDPGETLEVRGGTYATGSLYARQGTASAPITVEAYPGEQPILTPPNDGLNSNTNPEQNSLRIQDAAYSTFRGLTLQHAGLGSNHVNLWVKGTSHHILIERNTLRWSREGSGTFVGYTTHHIDYIGNTVYENNGANQHQGIYHEGDNSIIARNVVYGQTNGFGIQVRSDSGFVDGVTVAQNTTADNSLSGIVILDTASNTRVVNNISAYNDYGIRGYDDAGGSANMGNTASNNLLYGNRAGGCVSQKAGIIACGTQLPAADPKFVNHTGRDYRLITTDPNRSPAIDKALTPWYWPDPDGTGVPRGLQGLADAGGFESG